MDFYWYTYVLLNKGSVFYIGFSAWPMDRYKNHCSSIDSKAYDYIYWMIEEGNYPDMVLIGRHDNRQTAREEESFLIKYHVAIGHKLCNDDQNPHYNRIIQCSTWGLKRSKRLPLNYARFIRQKVQDYEKHRNRLYQMGYPTAIGY